MGRHGSRWALLALLLAALAPARAGEGEGDLGKLQGCWATKVGTGGGFVVELRIQGRAVQASIREAGGATIRAEGELRIDESARPKRLDWVKFTTADGQEVPDVLGIYRLEGGRLLIRSGGLHGGRPDRFEEGDGIWAGVLAFERR
jgi:uncharacterized protein (TIGR03067 family)